MGAAGFEPATFRTTVRSRVKHGVRRNLSLKYLQIDSTGEANRVRGRADTAQYGGVWPNEWPNGRLHQDIEKDGLHG